MDDDGNDDGEKVERKRPDNELAVVNRLKLRRACGGSSDEVLCLPRHTWRRPNPVRRELLLRRSSIIPVIVDYALLAFCTLSRFLMVVEASFASITYLGSYFKSKRLREQMNWDRYIKHRKNTKENKGRRVRKSIN